MDKKEYEEYQEFLKLEEWWKEITEKAILSLKKTHKKKYERFIELREKTKPFDT